MKASDVLRVNRELMRYAWTREVLARDAYHNPVESSYPSACRFCSLGGLKALRTRKLVPGLAVDRAVMFLNRALMFFNGLSVPSISDSSQESAVRLHDHAIELAESEGQ